MLVTYNRNVNKLKKTGESAITWKCFAQTHEIFAEEKSVKTISVKQSPVKQSLDSIFKPETLILADESNDSTYDKNAYVQNIHSSKKEKNKFSNKKEYLISRKCITSYRRKKIRSNATKERNLGR